MYLHSLMLASTIGYVERIVVIDLFDNINIRKLTLVVPDVIFKVHVQATKS